MSKHLITSSRIVTPGGTRAGGVLVENGLISAILPPGAGPSGAVVSDFGDAVVMPGVVDIHVHINEPGRTSWEGFQTATRAAAAGGVTTVVDMPLNSTPATTSRAELRRKVEAAHGKLSVNCGFHGGLVPANAARLRDLAASGVLGIKAFLVHPGVDDFPNVKESDLRLAMPVLSELEIPLLVHAELDLAPSRAPVDCRSYRQYAESRPAEMELRAIQILLKLCRKYRTRLHIVHLAAADALSLLEQAKDEGLPVTAETCPHYLHFAAETVADGDTRFKCAPPIRGEANREQLWEGLRAGTIDLIASDHSPCDPSLKCSDAGDFAAAWGGISGLQFTLPVVWSGASARGFGLEDLARWLCRAPASRVGLAHRKGLIAVGYDADLVVWHPEQEVTIAAADILHRHKVTPYEGQRLRGRVLRTYVRGELAFDGTQAAEQASGEVLFREPA